MTITTSYFELTALISFFKKSTHTPFSHEALLLFCLDILTWEYKFSPNFCENSDGIWKKQNELEVTSPEEARQRTLLRPVSRHWIQSTERSV